MRSAGALISIGQLLVPRRAHFNYATCPLLRSSNRHASDKETQGRAGHHDLSLPPQVAVFRDCFQIASETPHAVLVQRLWKYRFDLTQPKRAGRARGQAFRFNTSGTAEVRRD